MRILIKYQFLLFLVLLSITTAAQDLVAKSPVRFLALGDSYTIGQGVEENERWPNQLTKKLEEKGAQIELLTNIARTGWTSDNLLGYVGGLEPDPPYNLVSLLIGVNNQFQGRNIDVYRTEFRELLEKAIAFCDGRKEGVFVLSIPDYGYTPFGLSDQERISQEIDAYNNINKQITQSMNIAYFDITQISRQVISKPSYLASDNLHPSGEMYARWVDIILNELDLELLTSNYQVDDATDELNLYPNPAKDLITINVPQNIRSIAIYDIRGIQVWELKDVKEEKISLDVSGWNKGMFIYRESDLNGKIKAGRFIIK